MKSNIKSLVTVIVPAYNGEKFIAQTLESIINQDYKNLEIILVDDVSTDNTVEISRKILENSGRKFQLIKRTVNGHQSAARNTGLDAANGDYIIFFDHDDLAEKNFVSSLYKEIEDKNADLVFCGFREYSKTDKKYKEFISEKIFSRPEDYLKEWATEKLELSSVWNFIFKKDFLVKNHLRFPEDCYIFEDVEFILKAIAVSSSVSYVNSVLYTHVYNPTQQTTADVKNRENYKNFSQKFFTLRRAGRCILKHTDNKVIRNYILSYLFPEKFLKWCTLSACAGDYDFYRNKIKHFRHKKVREIMLSTFKFIFREPELFFKSLMLLYAPNLYYKIRSRKSKIKE